MKNFSNFMLSFVKDYKMTKNKEIKNIHKNFYDKLKQVRKEFKSKDSRDIKKVNKLLKEVNSLLSELNSYKKTLLDYKDERKYALNFDFPVRKK